MTIAVDVSDIPAGTAATLYFDLIGFGAPDSSVIIDDVILETDESLSLTLEFDPESDSGISNSDLVTNKPLVRLVGTTNPLKEVSLDVGGDGSDEATKTANVDGNFVFSNVALSEGENPLRAYVENELGSTLDRSITVILDTQGPTGTLVAPAPASVVSRDLGYVEIQWDDPGLAGLNAGGTEDVSITGVSVDKAEDLGDGRWRYWYDQDGESLADGTIEVQLNAGQVHDIAGNTNPGSTHSFTLNTQLPIGTLVTPAAGSLTNEDRGFVDIQWTTNGPEDIDPATFDKYDITITGATVTMFDPVGDGLVRYFYDEGTLEEGTVDVVQVPGQVADLNGATNQEVRESFTLDLHKPLGSLATPQQGSHLTEAPSFIEIQWSDPGPAGLDETTFDENDISIPGITVTGVVAIGDGLVRYSLDGTFADGEVLVTLGAAEVTDLAGNNNVEITESFFLDTQGPIGSLRAPADGDAIRIDRGYVDVEWTTSGPAGLDEASVDRSDITINDGAVSVDRVQRFEDEEGIYHRYFYRDEGDSLTDGQVAVTILAAAVFDEAANDNEEAGGTFILDRQPPSGTLLSPVPDTTVQQDLGYIDIQWTDTGPAGLNPLAPSTSDITLAVSGSSTAEIPITHFEDLDSGVIRYFYGNALPNGTIIVTQRPSVVTDRAGNPNPPRADAFTLDAQQPPNADAGGPYIIDEGQDLTLDASLSSDPDLDPLSFAWDIDGDGVFEDATGTSPTLTWEQLQALGLNDDGDFTIAVRVSDADSSTDDTAQLTIQNAPPTIAINGPFTINEGDNLALGSLASDPSSADDAILTYSWDLNDDGAFDDATGAAPTVAWTDLQLLGLNDDGEFTITLRVFDDDTFTDETAQLAITNTPPTADAGGPYTISEGGDVTLAGSGDDPSAVDDANLTYSWDFNSDGTFDDATSATPTVPWADLQLLGLNNDGEFTITLRVFDDDTFTDDTTELSITNTPPTSDAGGPYTINEGDNLTLARSGNDPSTADNAILTYSWDLNGDGSFDDATGATPTVAWADLQLLGLDNDGEFTITLRVFDDDTFTDDTAQLTIANTPPTADAGGPYTINEGDDLALAGSADDPSSADNAILTYSWDLKR